MIQHTIQLTEGIARNPQVRLQAPASIDLLDGEHLAVVGSNAGGKSLLVDLLTGRYPLLRGEAIRYDFRPSATTTVYENIRHLTFKDVTYCSQEGNYYYQQRWNHTEQEDFPTVAELLGECRDEALKQHLFDLFRVAPLLDKKIILLSSGELRKFQLTKTLLAAPRILILDNPFIGLDATAREQLTEVLTQLSRESVQLILVLSMLDDIPPFITHVLPVEELRGGEKLTRDAYLEQFRSRDAALRPCHDAELSALRRRILDLPYTHTNFTGEEVVRLNKVSIRYGERTILRELDWLVRRGERWALSGENGSGKSTLLSLVCADNPQSYACDISLFGRKRGSGESIWEIKQHIGYVSPEMHRAYLKNLPAIEIVASGLHDTVGLYKRPRPEELDVCRWWMDIFGVAHLADRLFLQLSSGEQRLCLLARAFVKDPELLILDEPLHGLDTYNRRRVKAVIEAFCSRKDKTLVMVTHYQEELPDGITHHLHLKRN